MIMIKQLGSHVDLQTGENKHSMVVGRVDQEAGFEIEIDGPAYLQLGELVSHLMSSEPTQSPVVQESSALQREVFGGGPPTTNLTDHRVADEVPEMTEAQLEAHLRELEVAAGAQQQKEAGSPSSADELLRQVGWFGDSKDEVSGPADALADFDDEEDPGEDYPEEDGVEGI